MISEFKIKLYVVILMICLWAWACFFLPDLYHALIHLEYDTNSLASRRTFKTVHVVFDQKPVLFIYHFVVDALAWLSVFALSLVLTLRVWQGPDACKWWHER